MPDKTLDKTFDPKAIEDKHYRAWEASGAFAGDPAGGKPPFTIMMPPPNVTGSLHMGHALNMTLQDILTRYNRMKGRDALWQPGTDHAGIATQMVVERLLDSEGTNRHKLGREKFLERVWDWKAESGGTINSQLRRLGAFPDWARERFTMDEGLSRAVRKVFVQLYKEGLIYKDKRLVNWDPKLLTAISDLEVEQREQKGHMWHIAYPVEGPEARTITVATTRPETMLGDTAVAVHPDDERYQDLIGKSVCLPITGRLIPIIADEYSDPEKGTGAVKITPAHDFNDFEVGKRHDLPMVNVFDIHARIAPLESIPKSYHGLDRYEARKAVLRELEELDCLVKIEDVKNSLPYGDRSGVVIEPFLTDQWYVDAATLAKPAIETVETGETVFVPKNWENTYFEWMRNIQPWCISRQLWWGHQIPAWYGPDKHVFVAETEQEAQKEADAHYGEAVEITRDPDVLDTWFSSALWPFSTLGWPEATPELSKYYPGDVLVTGFDIIFFWVARMMMMGLHFMKDVPFRTVYIHALVRDAKGQKMSKSKGNVMDPLDLIDQYGADALRFTMTAMAAQGRDIKLSEQRVEGYRNFATKLWNASRFCQMNGCAPVAGFDPAQVTATANKWIVAEMALAARKMEEAIESYKFNEAATAIYQFSWGTFCDWYVEFIKPLFAEGQEGHPLAAETRATTGWLLDQILTLLHPVMPFITEELYGALGERENGLSDAAWPLYPDLANEKAQAEMSWLIALISEIRSVRTDMNIPAGAKIDLFVKDAGQETQNRLRDHDEAIRRMARLSKIELADTVPKGALQTVLGEATLILPVADIIDLDQERARLTKQIAKLEQDIEKISRNLNNAEFVRNAPPEILEENKSRMEDAALAKGKLTLALKQLEAA
ncbi:MAG: valine--tRNA ligase [Alphaproteobacteria bacterium]|nr:valine--tRNA ligase [Alphaproteobacteria bacterium]